MNGVFLFSSLARRCTRTDNTLLSTSTMNMAKVKPQDDPANKNQRASTVSFKLLGIQGSQLKLDECLSCATEGEMAIQALSAI